MVARRGRKSWDREVVRVALSSGWGEGFLARQWARSREEGFCCRAAAPKGRVFPGHCKKIAMLVFVRFVVFFIFFLK